MTTRQILPLIALRGMTIFPHMVISFPIGRAKSLRALEEAQAGENLVFVVKQRQAEEENPGFDDLCQMGTVMKIKQVLRLPGNVTHVIAEGLSRGKLEALLEGEPCQQADFTPLPQEEEREESTSVLAMMRLAAEKYDAYVRLGAPGSQNDTMVNVVSAKNAGQMADVIAAGLQVSPEEKQEWLEMTDGVCRLSAVLQKVNEELEILQLKEELDKKVRVRMEEAQKEYYLREQLKVIQEELGDKDGVTALADGYVQAAKEKHLPPQAMAVVEQESERLKKMALSAPEANVSRNYVEHILALPWEEKTEEKVDIAVAEAVLQEDHYGLKEVKERILEFLAVQQQTGRMGATILCLAGPPGVGKTSIAKSIARALGRKYVRMSLGGVKDESEIRGHRRTYVGAMSGRILNAMKQAGVINPLILLDEVDKLSVSYNGDPAAALLEVLDGEQNNQFTDHYLEIPYDLSQVLFLCTANEVEKIPGPLRDRMEVISLSGYTLDEKVEIALRHLYPKQLELAGLTKEDLRLEKGAVIALAEGYTREAGVRQLERTIGKICRKVVKERLKGRTRPIRLTAKGVGRYLGTPKVRHLMANETPLVGVVRGLAWTAVGGETLEVETVLTEGKGRLVLTGSMGDVMQESAKTALTYVRSLENLARAADLFEKKDVHIHIPAGAVPKDGPSAGVTMATAICSAVTGAKVRADVAMTGEVTITGRVLAIGGLKEKLLAARQANLLTVIVPKENEADVAEMEKSVWQGMTICYAARMEEVWKTAFVEGETIWK